MNPKERIENLIRECLKLGLTVQETEAILKEATDIVFETFKEYLYVDNTFIQDKHYVQ